MGSLLTVRKPDGSLVKYQITEQHQTASPGYIAINPSTQLALTLLGRNAPSYFIYNNEKWLLEGVE